MWLGLWHHTALYLDTDVSGGPAASSSRGNGGTRSSEKAVPTHETARCSNRDDRNMKNSGAQISGAWPSGRLNFVRLRLMFADPSVSYLNYCTLLAPIILKWLLYFWKICVLLLKITYQNTPRKYCHELRHSSEDVMCRWSTEWGKEDDVQFCDLGVQKYLLNASLNLLCFRVVNISETVKRGLRKLHNEELYWSAAMNMKIYFHFITKTWYFLTEK